MPESTPVPPPEILTTFYTSLWKMLNHYLRALAISHAEHLKRINFEACPEPEKIKLQEMASVIAETYTALERISELEDRSFEVNVYTTIKFALSCLLPQFSLSEVKVEFNVSSSDFAEPITLNPLRVIIGVASAVSAVCQFCSDIACITISVGQRENTLWVRITYTGKPLWNDPILAVHEGRGLDNFTYMPFSLVRATAKVAAHNSASGSTVLDLGFPIE